ncbi:MAG TPA: O-antigen ligase family protein [Thermomicrobiales bacterium]|nr:O-antigen ligase family protein [Thermomicrobiales bacterium]
MSGAVVSAIVIGGVLGVVVTRGGPQLALLALAATLAIALLLRSVWNSYAFVIGALALLPFAVMPIDVGVRPTLLSLALVTALASVGAVTLIDRRERLQVGVPHALVLLLIGVTAFALLLGVGRGYTPQTLHDYVKFVLGILAFFLTTQLVRSARDGRRLLLMLLAGAGGAGSIALLLYAGGPDVTHRALARLIPYGYPGDRVVRYIEDNPALAMRAVGTGVDPNSFGGLMMVGFVLAVSQLLVRHRSVPIWLTTGVSILTCAAMLLTYSRGAWMGALAGVGLVILLRRPLLVLPAVGLGALGLAAGVGSGFVTRLWLGFTLQDPATRLRLAEYRNAWDIIQRHPWFGVGFGDAPTIDLQVGVSSVYLTIAERAGFIGLLVFVVALGVVGWGGLRSSASSEHDATTDLALTFTAALAATLTVGLVDHYFFNPQFPHMAALLWIVAGTIVSIAPFPHASDVSRADVSSFQRNQLRRGARRRESARRRRDLTRTGEP